MKQYQVQCPECQHQFDAQEALTFQIQQRVSDQVEQHRQKLTDQYQSKEEALDKQQAQLLLQHDALEKTIHRRVQEQTTAMRQSLATEVEEEFTLKIQYYEEELARRREATQQVRSLEVALQRLQNEKEEEVHRLNQDLAEQNAQQQRQLRQQLTHRLQQEHALKLEEKDLKLRTLERQLGDMKRKIEQGSSQQQGEAHEIVLSQHLQELFPSDQISEVPKGQLGADVIQHVFNARHQEAGKIIYECKRTKHFNPEWIGKLKEDQLRENGQAVVLVTEAMPKEGQRVELIQGVWVTDIVSYPAVAKLLRDGILRVDQVQMLQHNQGDKMNMLFQYLTSSEFCLQMEAIVEGFTFLKQGIVKEQMMMRKIWKEREKVVDRVLINTSDMYGSIKGIAGSAVPALKALTFSEDL